jgi:apolipoprotein N-acyltransferase
LKPALAGTLSGILLVLSFPSFDFSLAAWVALVPLLYQLSQSTPRQGLVGGAVMGVVCHIGLVYWTSEVMVQYGGLSRPVSIAVLMTLVAYLTVFTMVFGGLAALAWRLDGLRTVVVIPFVWVGLEYFRAYPWGGFPWCLLGYSQVGVLPVIQAASVTGIHGISLLIALVNVTIVYCLTGPGIKKALLAGAPVLMLLAAVLGFGFSELSKTVPEPTYPVAVVQGSVLQEHKWDPSYASKIYSDHINLSWQAVQQGARLVIWPESSTPFHFDGSPTLAEHMKSFTRQSNVYLLFGSDDIDFHEAEEGGGYTAYNGAKLITPEGDVTLRYYKNILVPFGEYVPMRWLFFFAESLMEGVSDFTSGGEILVASVDQGKVGTYICYEAIYPDLIRRFVKNGAGLLINLTNDAWFGRSSAPHQHLNMAVARAVETRRYMVRAANTGISAIVDPYGRVLKQSDLFTQEVVSGKITFRSDETPFVRYGNIVAYSSAILTVLFGITALILYKKDRK